MGKEYYHYTSLRNLYNIISNNELWFANLKNSNDPNELYLTHEKYNKYIEKLKSDPYHGTPVILNENNILGSPFGVSFTTLEDDMCQWERYGDNFSGVAIKFNISFLQSYLSENFKFKFYFDSMKYEEKDKEKLIQDNILSIREFKNYKWEKHWPFYALYYIVHYAQARSLFKSSSFSNENEYRLFFDPVEYDFYYDIINKFEGNFLEDKKRDSLECHEMLENILHLLNKDRKYALMRNGINSYLSLDLNLFGEKKKNLIEGITLGPKCTQDITVLNEFLEFGEVSNIYNFTLANIAIHIVVILCICLCSYLHTKKQIAENKED